MYMYTTCKYQKRFDFIAKMYNYNYFEHGNNFYNEEINKTE